MAFKDIILEKENKENIFTSALYIAEYAKSDEKSAIKERQTTWCLRNIIWNHFRGASQETSFIFNSIFCLLRADKSDRMEDDLKHEREKQFIECRANANAKMFIFRKRTESVNVRSTTKI